MIVTVTPNPSLDRTIPLGGGLRQGSVHRTRGSRTEPGGKGINVARVCAAAGHPALAIVPAKSRGPLLTALDELGVPHRTVPTAGDCRTNIAITEPDGTTTKLNEPGRVAEPHTAVALRAALAEAAQAGDWVVLAGSLPPGFDDRWYADTVGAARVLGCKIAVDTSDGPLLALAGTFPDNAPDLIKPNADELAQLTGHDPRDLESAAIAGDPWPALRAARLLVDRGVESALVTLGAGGAVLTNAEGAWWGRTDPIRARSTVGAGDSTLAGYLLAEVDGRTPAERLRLAVSYGAAAAALPGTTLPTPEDADPARTTVTPLAPLSPVTSLG